MARIASSNTGPVPQEHRMAARRILRAMVAFALAALCLALAAWSCSAIGGITLWALWESDRTMVLMAFVWPALFAGLGLVELTSGVLGYKEGAQLRKSHRVLRNVILVLGSGAVFILLVVRLRSLSDWITPTYLLVGSAVLCFVGLVDLRAAVRSQ